MLGGRRGCKAASGEKGWEITVQCQIITFILALCTQTTAQQQGGAVTNIPIFIQMTQRQRAQEMLPNNHHPSTFGASSARCLTKEMNVVFLRGQYGDVT